MKILFYFIMEPLCKDNFESNKIRKEKLISLLNQLIISKDEKEIKIIENEIKRINYFECENEYYFDLLPNWFNDMDKEDNSVGDFMWSYPEYYLEINFIKDILIKAHLDKLYNDYFEVCEDYEEYEEEVYDEEELKLYDFYAAADKVTKDMFIYPDEVDDDENKK